MIVYNGSSANEIWLNIAKDFILQEKTSVQMSRCGKMHEIIHACISLKNPSQRWIYSRIPPINPAFALAEVVWIFNGKNESKILNFWNPILPKYAGYNDKYYGAYGYRLRKNLGIDQIIKAFETLKNNPISRQAVLQIWDGRKDLPKTDGRPNNEDIPCNICSMLKIRDGALDWTQIVRSNDFFLGVPYNFIQFTILQELMAGWLKINTGEYNQLSDSLHIYEKHLEIIKKYDFLDMPNPAGNNISNIFNFSLEETEKYFHIIYGCMRKMTRTENKKTFYSLFSVQLPEFFSNIAYVIGADAAMRKGFYNIAEELIMRCNNHEYTFLWRKWANNWTCKSRKDKG